MKLRLVRDILTDVSTEGKLFVDGTFFSFTLELPVRDGLPGSAIPPGIFPVNIRFSNHFNRNVLHIDNIPYRSSIEIHPGNWVSNTRGCVLVGADRGENLIEHSATVSEELFSRVMQAHGVGEDCLIEIVGGEPAGQTGTNHDAVSNAATGEMG